MPLCEAVFGHGETKVGSAGCAAGAKWSRLNKVGTLQITADKISFRTGGICLHQCTAAVERLQEEAKLAGGYLMMLRGGFTHFCRL